MERIKKNFAFFQKCHAYETALELMEEGKFRHFGISFHDKAEVLEQILNEYPQIEVVQIQFNYADYDDLAVESRKCYEVCRKFGKPVIVMEPVKGGNLVNLPQNAKSILEELHGGSPASYAIRFAARFEGINTRFATAVRRFIMNCVSHKTIHLKRVWHVFDIVFYLREFYTEFIGGK